MHSLSSVYVHSSFNNLLLRPVDLSSTRMKLPCNHIHYTNAACGFGNTTSTCTFKVHRKGAEFSKYHILSCQSNKKARGSKSKHSILTGQPRPIQIQGNIQTNYITNINSRPFSMGPTSIRLCWECGSQFLLFSFIFTAFQYKTHLAMGQVSSKINTL